MSERSGRLLAQLSEIRPEFVAEAAEDAPRRAKPVHWKRWTALAACLALLVVGALGLLPRMGGSGGSPGAGDSGTADGGSTFMSYAGPVFPLTLREENSAVSAERHITLDFVFWVKDWWSGEGTGADLTEAQRQKLLDLYNGWFPESIHYYSTTDVLVTDAYTLTNTSSEDQTLTLLYPFAGQLAGLGSQRPALTMDGAVLDTTLYAGRYTGGYMGAVGGDLVTPVEEGSVNLDDPHSWEEYRDALADGTYQGNALGGYPDLSGTPVIVYEFTDPWGPEEDSEAGIPNPTIRAAFHQDVEHSQVLTTGFHGGRYDWDTGEMVRLFSISQPGERDYGEQVCRLIVLGADIENLETQGYATGGFDTEKTVEAGVTVTRRETDLETVLREAVREQYSNWGGNVDKEAVNFEMYYGLLKTALVTAGGPLSGSVAQRYDTGALEDMDVWSVDRVLYLEAAVTVPAGGSVQLTATLRKGGSYDFYGAKGEQRGVYGYDAVTRLGSNLACTAQTAALEDRGQIQIVRQNFGFDLENGVKSVTLDPAVDHYYLEVRRAPEGD